MSLRNLAIPVLLSCLLQRPPVLAAQEPASSDIVLREHVRRAIKNGADFLRRTQQADGTFSVPEAEYSEYTAGLTALALLAQINCDVPVESPQIQRGLQYLRSVRLSELRHGVYQASLMLMAFCAAEELDRDLVRIQQLARVLQNSQATQGPMAGLWGYGLAGYGHSVGYGDRSNGQFAVLALRDAAYAGVSVDRDVWQRTHDQWVRGQNRDGGWGYRNRESSRGSMTVAGLSTVAITTHMLQDDSDVDADGRPDCCADHPPDEAAERGRKWLTERFTVHGNPGHHRWQLYYLYGLERAGRLSGVRFFGLHDWYRSGARALVERQQPDGRWSIRGTESNPVLATSFALIFLSKGLSRVVVNKLDYSSGPRAEDSRGDWNRHHLDIPGLVDRIDTLKGWPPRLTSQVLSLNRLQEQTAVLDMNQAPVLYLSGRDTPALTDQQVRWLREYVDQGGFIFGLANCGNGSFDAGFRDLITRMFPQGEASLKRLQADHPIYRSEFLLNADNVELLGVDFGCRTTIVYSPEDHACYWHKWSRHTPLGRSQDLTQRIIRSTRVGVNVLAYATGREPPEKLNEAMTAKERAGRLPTRGLLEIAQLRHNGGWDTAPRAVRNLLEGLNRTTGLGVSPQRNAVPITLSELSRFPIAYMHGRFGFRLQVTERDALRDYLSRGTLLFADACCGSPRFDRSFRDLMHQLYPDHPLEPIPADHPLLTETTGYDVTRVRLRRLIPGERTASLQTRIKEGPPVLEGIQINGQYVVIYSRYDLSCALENQASLACDGYVEEDAMKLAINIVLFGLLQEITQ